MSTRPLRAAALRLALAGGVLVLLAFLAVLPVAAAEPGASGDPSASASAEPSPSPAPSASPSPTGSPEPSPSPSPDPSPSPTPTPDPSPTPSPTPSPSPSPTPSPTPAYSMNLYKSAGYVRQYTSSWCTSAAAQMMGNLVRLRTSATAWVDRTFSRQQAIISYAKRVDTLRWSNGTDPHGWAAALRKFGMGSAYHWHAFGDYDTALRHAVERLRLTGRPVGLLAWGGRHAWVLHGFTATADPAATSDYRILTVRVSGPLKGTDPINGAYTPSQLKSRWGRYGERDGYLGWVGDYVLISA